MRRFFVFVILFFILIGLCYPYVTGLVLRHEIKKSVEELNHRLTDDRSSGSIKNVAITHYRTRYSTSDIEWVVKAPFLESWFDTSDIILLDRVTHTLAHKVVSQTSLEKNMEYNTWTDRYLNGKDPLTITTQYFLSGDIKAFVSMDEFVYINGTKIVHVKPGTLAFEFHKDLDQVVLNLSWDGIDIPGVRRIDPLHMVARMDRKGDIWQGTSQFNLDGFWLHSGRNRLALTKLAGEYGLMVDENNSIISIDLSAAIESGSSQKWNFSSARGKMLLHNLDLDGFYQFIRLNKESNNHFLRQVILAESGAREQDRIVEQALKNMGDHLIKVYEKFLRKGLKIHFDQFHITIPEGDIRADVFLELKKRITLPGLIPVLLKPKLALDLLLLKSDICIPHDIVDDSTVLTTPFFEGMQTGLFVSHGQTLGHQAEISPKGVWVNHKAVELGE